MLHLLSFRLGDHYVSCLRSGVLIQGNQELLQQLFLGLVQTHLQIEQYWHQVPQPIPLNMSSAVQNLAANLSKMMTVNIDI
jgi:hypothetical protein